MALKLLVIFILLYFVAKAIGNMVQAILRDPKAPPPVPPPTSADRTPSWRNQSPPQPTRRSGPDIEDAKWVDLD